MDYPDTELTYAQAEALGWDRIARRMAEGVPARGPFTLEDAVGHPEFLDALIKRSPEADQVLGLCGCILLRRTVAAAVELYLERFRPAESKEG